MQIVIEISKYIADMCKECGCVIDADTEKVGKAIKNGTPLPEHHGDLKDVDEIAKAIEDRVEFLRKNDAIFMRLRKDIDILGCIPKIRCEVPTIIEADKEITDEANH